MARCGRTPPHACSGLSTTENKDLTAVGLTAALKASGRLLEVHAPASVQREITYLGDCGRARGLLEQQHHGPNSSATKWPVGVGQVLPLDLCSMQSWLLA